MHRMFLFAASAVLVLAIGCGGAGSGQTTTAGVSDPGGDTGPGTTELPPPSVTAEPTPTPTPTAIVSSWDTESALYTEVPADGVLLPPAELACLKTTCPGIVLIGCSGTTTRVGDHVTGENRCRSLPASATFLDEFTVLTDGPVDPTTNQIAMHGTATLANGFSYDYEVTVQMSPDGLSLSGTGSVDGNWPLVIAGKRVD